MDDELFEIYLLYGLRLFSKLSLEKDYCIKKQVTEALRHQKPETAAKLLIDNYKSKITKLERLLDQINKGN